MNISNAPTRHTKYALRNYTSNKAVVSELADQKFIMFNQDLPLKKMVAVLNILTGLNLDTVEMQMAMVASGGPKGYAVPMTTNNSKLAHHGRMIINNRNITGGPACYPRKCAKCVLKIVRYLKSMKKTISEEKGHKVILYLKSAFATKGHCLKRLNIRAMGVSYMKVRQKVNIRAVAGVLIVKDEK